MHTMIYPTTNFKATEQLVVTRGEGVYVYDKASRLSRRTPIHLLYIYFAGNVGFAVSLKVIWRP